MSETKIQLSQVELELAANAAVILTKNAIIEKVKLLLSELQLKQQAHLLPYSREFPPEVHNSSPKIYRGEKYNDLPYVLLDYPQVFNKQNVFAIRTLFWWGHFFSCTLHISGEYKTRFLSSLLTNYERLKADGFHICINDDEWEHHFDEGNYRRIDEISKEAFENYCRVKNFCKLAAKTAIAEPSEVSTTLLRYFGNLTTIIADQPPRR